MMLLKQIAGAVYVLFVPGLALSFALFRRGAIDWIERLALSFALSIAVVPLVAFYLNLVGVKISGVDVVAEVGVITLAGLVVAAVRRSWQVGESAPVVRPKAKPGPTVAAPLRAVPPSVRRVARRVKKRIVRL